MTSISFVAPRSPLEFETIPINPLGSLEGVTLGLLNNSKPNSAALLDEVAAIIGQRVSLRDVVKASKALPSTAAPDDVIGTMADRSGATIFASAD